MVDRPLYDSLVAIVQRYLGQGTKPEDALVTIESFYADAKVILGNMTSQEGGNQSGPTPGN